MNKGGEQERAMTYYGSGLLDSISSYSYAGIIRIRSEGLFSAHQSDGHP